MKISIFFLMFLLLNILGGIYLYYHYIHTTRWFYSRAWGAILIFFLIGGYIAIMAFSRSGALSSSHSYLANLILWSAYLALGFVSILLAYTLIMDIILLIIKVLPSNGESSPLNPERRQFFMDTIKIGAIGLAGASTIIGVNQARHSIKIYKVDIPIEGLHPDLEGFRIAQISDVHVGPTIKRSYVEKIVELTNNLKADLIAFTGDMVDGSVSYLRKDVEPFSNLQSKYGTYFCTGNHEYYSGALEWIEECKRLGFKVLNNEHELIEHKTAKLLLAGVYDYKSKNIIPSHISSPKEAIKNAPPSDLKILLAHQPQNIDEADEAGFQLQLTGHTHGGQFFPFTYIIYFFQKYVKGLYRHSERIWIYVNRGTGYWGPPIRFTNPPEITEITLKKV